MPVSNRYILIPAFATALALVGCSGNEEEKPIDYSELKEDLYDENKRKYQEEMLAIESFVKRRNWNMITSGTGLYYSIYKHADTLLPTIKEGQIARVNFTVFLISDTLSECYTSDGEPEDFMVGMDNVESGLHEGIMYMRKGEKAKLILPSHRAFGLVGDQDMIPPRSTLLYDIELVDIIDTDQSKIIEKNNENRKKLAEQELKLQEGKK
ncbi:MAG: FKBP-type peptidyl-prolyl cis-trans isomerase [Flavobacteriales bacterium]